MTLFNTLPHHQLFQIFTIIPNAINTSPYQQMAFLIMSAGKARSLCSVSLHFVPFLAMLSYIRIHTSLQILSSSILSFSTDSSDTYYVPSTVLFSKLTIW